MPTAKHMAMVKTKEPEKAEVDRMLLVVVNILFISNGRCMYCNDNVCDHEKYKEKTNMVHS